MLRNEPFAGKVSVLSQYSTYLVFVPLAFVPFCHAPVSLRSHAHTLLCLPHPSQSAGPLLTLIFMGTGPVFSLCQQMIDV